MKINLFNRTLEVSRIGDVLGWPYASERTSGVFYFEGRNYNERKIKDNIERNTSQCLAC